MQTGPADSGARPIEDIDGRDLAWLTILTNVLTKLPQGEWGWNRWDEEKRRNSAGVLTRTERQPCHSA